MFRQEDINARMRAILIDWLVEVHMKFRLVPETLYLCVSIIDRYCCKVDVLRSKLQLIGVTALLVACKHEEIYPPEVRDCVYITDRAYNRQEVLDMEQEILKVLDWKISVPTAFPFLDRFLCLSDASEMTKHAAAYYLERTLQEHSFLQFRPSVVCASAVILALNNPDIRVQEEDLDRELPGFVSGQIETVTPTSFDLLLISHTHFSLYYSLQPKILMEYTGFSEFELTTCMERMAEKVGEEPITASRRQLNAVKKKYENSKYLEVSTNVELPNVQYVLEANK
jgi:cyclin B